MSDFTDDSTAPLSHFSMSSVGSPASKCGDHTLNKVSSGVRTVRPFRQVSSRAPNGFNDISGSIFLSNCCSFKWKLKWSLISTSLIKSASRKLTAGVKNL